MNIGLLISIVLSISNLYAQDKVWKSIFIAGDHSIANFDNGRKDLAKMLAPLGAFEEHQIHLTSSQGELNNKTVLANGTNIENAFSSMKVKSSEGCFIFMTSHGSKNQGFYLSRAGILTPAKLAEMVNKACADAPTVILVSACYSGQFITAGLTGKNRVILTAAIKDRPSFGCSQDTKYTYWDECLLEAIPTSQNWKDVYEDAKSCVSQKETRLGYNPSFPQAFFGEGVKDLAVLNK
jgi:hypothetical protein